MKLVLTEFLTLDGVYQGPGSPTEDTSDGFARGGWLVPYMDEVFVRRAAEWLRSADGLVLGRRTYEAFARDWPAITDPGDPFTELMNSLPKYVVSTSLGEGGWRPVTVLRSLEAVAKLKDLPGSELQVHGSGRLGRALFGAGLIDGVRLVVAPTVIGTGRRLFEGRGRPRGCDSRSTRRLPAACCYSSTRLSVPRRRVSTKGFPRWCDCQKNRPRNAREAVPVCSPRQVMCLLGDR